MSLVGFWSLLMFAFFQAGYDKNGIHSHLFNSLRAWHRAHRWRSWSWPSQPWHVVCWESWLNCGSWPENFGPGGCGPGKSGKQKLGTLWWFYKWGERTTYYRGNNLVYHEISGFTSYWTCLESLQTNHYPVDSAIHLKYNWSQYSRIN